jgi:hypothetical protein
MMVRIVTAGGTAIAAPHRKVTKTIFEWQE